VTGSWLQVTERVCRRGLLLLLLATGSLSLVACGFHLRGAVVLPPQMERTQLVGIDARSALAEEIRTALENAGARVVEVDATAQLVISGEREARRLLSVGSTGRASEYELTYQFSYELRAPAQDKTGEAITVVLLPQQTMSLNRDYSFDPDNVLGKGEEEALLLREMRAFAVRQMLLRLRAGLHAQDSAQ